MAEPSEAPVWQSDDDLMRRVQDDDPLAFALLYDRYAPRALLVARSVCHDLGRAEDAVQEGFLSMWHNRMSYRCSGSFNSWAMLSVRHRAIDSFRREAVRPQLAEAQADKSDPASRSVPAQVIARDEADALRAALERLPQAQAEVIKFAFFGQLSHPEIAERLSLAAGTVKGRMRLGFEKLAREMDAAE